MSTAVVETPAERAGNIMEQVVQGNLASLTPAERVKYLVQVCQDLAINPSTSPFKFMTFNGKVVMYATKDATEQLRKRDCVSVKIVARELLPDETYVVTARATVPGNTPRCDESIGAVSLKGISGEGRANAIMKCETKAKRRVTLSICGLGFLDESEVDSIPGAQIESRPPQAQLSPPAAQPQLPAPATVPEQITLEQIGQIADLRKELGVTDEEFVGKLVQAFQINDIRKLNVIQGEQILRGLRSKKAKTVAA